VQTTEHSHFKGEAIPYTVEKKRSLSVGRCILHLGICHQTWRNYQKLDSETHEQSEIDAYKAACSWVEETISAMKLEHAHAGLLNPGIVCRELGLKESSKMVTDDGEGGDAPMQPVAFLPPNGREVKNA